MVLRACFAGFLLLVLLVGACGGGAATKATTSTGTATGGSTSTGTATGGTATGGAAAGAGGAGGMGGATPDAGPMCMPSDAPYGDAAIAAASCASPPPPGAPTPPAPKPYTGGTCPTLAAGTNSITSMGNARSFLLAVPSSPMPGEQFPVIFLWYWLKGSPQDFYDIGEVQAAVDQQRFLAVIPDAKGDLFYNWPFTVNESQARIDEEYTYFDDMLSCVSAQFDVNAGCVSSVGVSAGALFTDQLVGARSQYLSSFISLSGGVAYPNPTALLRPWTPPSHPLPALVLWGGSQDDCLFIQFDNASHALEQDLAQACTFMLECVHNCGHSEPPFTAAEGLSTYAALWQFALNHPYWLPPGTSPFTTHGLPPGTPEWCAIGAGNAVPRTGPCNGSGC